MVSKLHPFIFPGMLNRGKSYLTIQRPKNLRHRTIFKETTSILPDWYVLHKSVSSKAAYITIPLISKDVADQALFYQSVFIVTLQRALLTHPRELLISLAQVFSIWPAWRYCVGNRHGSGL